MLAVHSLRLEDSSKIRTSSSVQYMPKKFFMTQVYTSYVFRLTCFRHLSSFAVSMMVTDSAVGSLKIAITL